MSTPAQFVPGAGLDPTMPEFSGVTPVGDPSSPDFYSVNYGPGSEHAQRGWNDMLLKRRQIFDETMSRLHMANLASQHSGLTEQQALSIVDAHQAAKGPQVTPTELDDLIGAAITYGIPNPEKIPPQALAKIVEARRASIPKDQLSTPELAATVASALGVGATQTMVKTLMKMPFLGDLVFKDMGAQKLDQYLGALKEGLRADLVPDQAQSIDIGSSIGGAIGYLVPGELGWMAAGKLGAMGSLAQMGSRLSPIAKLAIRGGTTAAILEGGGDEPLGTQKTYGLPFTEHGPTITMNERVAKIALGAALPLAGAGLMSMAKRLAASFPSRAINVGIFDEENFATYDADPDFRGDLGQGGGPAVGGPPAGPPGLPPSPYSVGGDVKRPAYPMGPISGQPRPAWGDINRGLAIPEAVSLDEAAGAGESLTKQATIFESPAAAELAGQPRFDDSDVAQAAMRSAPAEIHVVKNLGDLAKTVSQLTRGEVGRLMPHEFRIVERDIHYLDQDMNPRVVTHHDLLVSNGLPISNKRVQQYKNFGMFDGQKAVTMDGHEVILENVDHKTPGFQGGDYALVKPQYGTANPYVVRRADIFPDRSTAIGPEEALGNTANRTYELLKLHAMNEMGEESALAGLHPPEWTDPQVASQLPRLAESFFAEQGIDNPVTISALSHYFNLRRVEDLKNLAPVEDLAALQEMHNLVREAQGEVAYHATLTEPGLGPDLHLGTRQAALDRLNQLRDFERDTNPDWQTAGSIHEMRVDPNARIYGTPSAPWPHDINPEIFPHDAQTVADMRAQGYQGMYYRNEVEDPGSSSLYLFDKSLASSVGRMTPPIPIEGQQLAESKGFSIEEKRSSQPNYVSQANQMFDLVEQNPNMEVWNLPGFEPGKGTFDLVDQLSGKTSSFGSYEAAIDFLRNTNRELPDLDPGGNIPAEALDSFPGTAHAGSTVDPEYDGEEHYVERGETAAVRLAEEVAMLDPREQGDWNWYGGGGGGVPPVGGYPAGGGGAGLPPGPAELRAQFAALTRQDAYEVMHQLDSFQLNYMMRMRNSTAAIEEMLLAACLGTRRRTIFLLILSDITFVRIW
jgi:hypothetical protein